MKRVAFTISALATVLLAIGSAAPWVTADGVINLSVGGLDSGHDGWVTLVAAAAIALGLWRQARRPNRRVPSAMAVVGVLALATCIADIADVNGVADSALANVSVGWGLMVATGASLAVVVGALALLGSAWSATGTPGVSRTVAREGTHAHAVL